MPAEHSVASTEHCEQGAHGHVSWPAHRRLRRRAAAWGLVGSSGLVVVYVAVLAAANSLEHAGSEMKRLWYWMVPILVGFGTQVGLFIYARSAARAKHGAQAHGVVASGTASTVSMIACCAHHLTEVLPVIGFAGAAAVLSSYQSLFLLAGVLSNLLGLVYVLSFVKKHGLFPERTSALSLSVRWPVEKALPLVGVLSGLVLAVAALLTLQR